MANVILHMSVLPVGVCVNHLTARADDRGSLVEMHRDSWPDSPPLPQFNLVRSAPGVMRGVHLHFHHADVVSTASGVAIIGLHDCRRESETFGLGAAVRISDTDVRVIIPVGVAHGFWMPDGGTLIYGLDTEWTPADELGCSWDDVNLAIPWGQFGDQHPADRPGGPLLSLRDSFAGSLGSMITEYSKHSVTA